MRELGPEAPQLHAGLAPDLIASGAQLLFACGPHMRHLADAVARKIPATHVERSVDLVAPLLAALRPGDVIMVKGSLGTNMKPIVTAILGLGEAAAAR
jgi:UDP-N-acetylmuramoyl-tripeptide--D-alanyl-D-alanine ligase